MAHRHLKSMGNTLNMLQMDPGSHFIKYNFTELWSSQTRMQHQKRKKYKYQADKQKLKKKSFKSFIVYTLSKDAKVKQNIGDYDCFQGFLVPRDRNYFFFKNKFHHEFILIFQFK